MNGLQQCSSGRVAARRHYQCSAALTLGSRRGRAWLLRDQRSSSVCPAAGRRVAYVLSDAAEHTKDGHPESVPRMQAVRRGVERVERDSSPALSRSIYQLHSDRQATDAELQLVHPASYLRRLAELCSTAQGPVMVDDSTYLCQGSLSASRTAIGTTLDLIDYVVKGQHTPGFALVRPPGHHVLPSRPMGFGLLNCVSVAARYAQQRHGLQRCLIFDFDVHHGNGTMEVFWEDPTVLYVSVHQDKLWPYTGKDTNKGGGAGLGSIINVPLPSGAGDEAMSTVIQEVLRPAARRFNPDIIIASAGYDAHWRDPLAGLQMRSVTYRRIARQLSKLAGALCAGRLLLVLEGGYDPQALSEGVASTLCGLVEGCQGDQEQTTTAHARTDTHAQTATHTGYQRDMKRALGYETTYEDRAKTAVHSGFDARKHESDLPASESGFEWCDKSESGLLTEEITDLSVTLDPEPSKRVLQAIDRVKRLHGL